MNLSNEWYQNYNNCNYEKPYNNINNELIQILLSKPKNSEEHIVNTIDNIESEYNNKINYINKLAIDSKLFDLKYNMSLSTDLLNEEFVMIKLLTKYTRENKNLDIQFVINSLNIIYKLSELLRIRLKQRPKTKSINRNKEGINRCSYNFCECSHNCSNYYNTKNRACQQDHYVHNMVSLDIQLLLEFINSNNIREVKNLKEIIKTINTLSYVINHMNNELKNYLIMCDYEDTSLI